MQTASNMTVPEGEIVPPSIACHVIQVTRFKPLKSEYYTHSSTQLRLYQKITSIASCSVAQPRSQSNTQHQRGEKTACHSWSHKTNRILSTDLFKAGSRGKNLDRFFCTRVVHRVRQTHSTFSTKLRKQMWTLLKLLTESHSLITDKLFIKLREKDLKKESKAAKLDIINSRFNFEVNWIFVGGGGGAQ